MSNIAIIEKTIANFFINYLSQEDDDCIFIYYSLVKITDNNTRFFNIKSGSGISNYFSKRLVYITLVFKTYKLI